MDPHTRAVVVATTVLMFLMSTGAQSPAVGIVQTVDAGDTPANTETKTEGDQQAPASGATNTTLSTVPCTCTGYASKWEKCEFDLQCVHQNTSQCRASENTAQVKKVDDRDGILVLRYNAHFDDIAFYRSELVEHCSVPCSFTDDKSKLAEADGVLFSIIYTTSFPSRKYPGQVYIAHCQEPSSIYYGRKLTDRDFMSNFEIKATYRKRSDVWVSYFLMEIFMQATAAGLPPVPAKTATAPVVWVASNCNTPNNRIEYVRELQHYISVHSYGKCLHNIDWPFPDDRNSPDYTQNKLNLLQSYKFTLAFENTNEVDYVTEKFFQPLRAGSVPVVMGAANIVDFAPSNHSFISVSDFKSPKELAQFLKKLDKNEALYNAYHDWRARRWSEQFENLRHTSYHTAPCRKLCGRCHGRLTEKSEQWGANAENTWYGDEYVLMWCPKCCERVPYDDSVGDMERFCATIDRSKVAFYQRNDLWRSTQTLQSVDTTVPCGCTRQTAPTQCPLCGMESIIPSSGDDPSTTLGPACYAKLISPVTHSTPSPPTIQEMRDSGRWPWFPMYLPPDKEQFVTIPSWRLKHGDAILIQVQLGKYESRIIFGNLGGEVFDIAFSATGEIILHGTVPTLNQAENCQGRLQDNNIIVFHVIDDVFSLWLNGKLAFQFLTSCIDLDQVQCLRFDGRIVISRVMYSKYTP
ncbi:Fucosyltransferase, N-terminal [Pelomyxa schiedti]|nr:Fucosyltransferase, N-terminal [Pelomyxa schiedti]